MTRLYRVLLLAYPRTFRHRYGEAMVGAFEEELLEAGDRPKARIALTLIWRALRDTLGTVVQMRWARWRGLPGAPISRRETRLAGWFRKVGRSGSPSSGGGKRQHYLDTLLMDLKFALRGLVRNPGFAVVAILTLALGIGASVAVFSVLEAVLLRQLPYPEPERVVQVRLRAFDGSEATISPGIFIRFQERNQVFAAMAAIERYPVGYTNLTGGDSPLRIEAPRVSANFFDVLGVDAAMGRTFLPEDDLPDATAVAVLSYGLWQRAFGGDPDIVGRTIRLDETPHTVVGVTPFEFTYPMPDGGTPDLWLAQPLPPDARNARSLTLWAVARIRPEVTVEGARAELDAIVEGLIEEYPYLADPRSGRRVGVVVEQYHRHLVQGVRVSLLMLAGGVGFVLLIAWVNVVNLLLARFNSREREIALRSAIGASRSRVARQLMTESLVLSVLGGAAGLFLARWMVTLFVALAPTPGGGRMGLTANAIPLLSRAEIGGWALAMTAVTCLVTAVACGIGPAIRAARTDPATGLRSGRQRGGDGRRAVGGQMLVAVEIALAMILLIGAGLLLTALARLSEIPLGFDPANVQVMRAELTRERYASLEEGVRGTRSARWKLRPEQGSLVTDVVGRLAALPGVDVAGAVNILPFQGAVSSNYGAALHFEWLDRSTERQRIFAGIPQHGRGFVATVTPDYFRAMGIPMLRGRGFSRSDDESAPRVAIVNQSLIDFFQLGENPVGKRLMVLDGTEWRSTEIVGVVGSVLQFGFYQMTLERGALGWSLVYLPYSQPATRYGRFQVDFHTTTNFVARHGGDGQAAGTAMREIFRRADPDTPIAFVDGMEAYVAENMMDRRFYMLLIGILAAVSLVLALIGVYGVMAFQVGQRVHEIGIRMALGARATGVVRMIVGEGSRVAVLGALMGVAGAMAATRLLSNWLYGVSPTDPVVFIGLAGVMVGAAVIACLVPARRAARVDPMASLRAE